MHNLTQEQIENIILDSKGRISDMNCRYLTHFMIGYLKNATNIENVRQDFYREVYENLKDGKEDPKDYEPEQAHGRADDFQKHVQYGGTREDY